MSRPGHPDLLAAIVAATRRSLEVRKRAEPEARLAEAAAGRVPGGARFVAGLSRPGAWNVIAECKRRSPSRGVLRRDYDAAWVAGRYEAGGAAAVSVLTEPGFFDGSLDDLRAVRARVALPLLRKDFVVDDYQLLEARAAGADAVLLIVAALQPAALRSLLAGAAGHGLAALVEVHRQEELAAALDAGARLVGVNCRNLSTLDVDLAVAARLVGGIPDDVVAVAESGLREPGDIRRLREAGYDAFLVGERLVAADDPGRALGELMPCS